MARLVYASIASLDGYVADREGRFDWSEPDEEVHAFVNGLESRIGTHLYGRRMYEVMSVWQEFGTDPGDPAVIREYGEIWRGADKVVFSSTLEEVDTPLTRLEPIFDAGAVRHLVETADRDVSVSGPTLAASALRVGLVDDLHLFVCPAVVGGGTPFLPPDLRLDLALCDSRTFGGGVVHLHYEVRRG